MTAAVGFEGFEEFDVPVGGSSVHGRMRAGSGPPVLLLHGIPETHLMWDAVAPALAEDRTVVCTDLRGYGGSGVGPGVVPGHAMRSLAADQVAVMRHLGHDRFAVVGHDRGARLGYRLAIDHPEAVTALVVMDIVPTGEAYARADAEFALGYWQWTFLAAPSPTPERLLGADPGALVDFMLDRWPRDPATFDAARRAIYTETFRDPERVHAICEQFRAAATRDVADDEADRGQGRLTAPVLALWGAGGAVDRWYDALAVWRQWAPDVRGRAVDCGHFLPEEAPGEIVDELRRFLAEHPGA